jgi:hypothetical protein
MCACMCVCARAYIYIMTMKAPILCTLVKKKSSNINSFENVMFAFKLSNVGCRRSHNIIMSQVTSKYFILFPAKYLARNV